MYMRVLIHMFVHAHVTQMSCVRACTCDLYACMHVHSSFVSHVHACIQLTLVHARTQLIRVTCACTHTAHSCHMCMHEHSSLVSLFHCFGFALTSAITSDKTSSSCSLVSKQQSFLKPLYVSHDVDYYLLFVLS